MFVYLNARLFFFLIFFNLSSATPPEPPQFPSFPAQAQAGVTGEGTQSRAGSVQLEAPHLLKANPESQFPAAPSGSGALDEEGAEGGTGTLGLLRGGVGV